MGGPRVFQQLHQHPDKAVNRVDRQAARVVELGQRVERAEYIARAIHQNQTAPRTFHMACKLPDAGNQGKREAAATRPWFGRGDNRGDRLFTLFVTRRRSFGNTPSEGGKCGLPSSVRERSGCWCSCWALRSQ